MEITELQPVDLEMFDFSGFIDDTRSIIESLTKKGGAFSVFHNGTILVIGGIIQHWQGVGEIWCLISNELLNRWSRWPFIHRQAQILIKRFFDDMGGHRLQTTVRCGFPQGKKWVKRLGFCFEGIMEAYGPDGQDYQRWAIVRGA